MSEHLFLQAATVAQLAETKAAAERTTAVQLAAAGATASEGAQQLAAALVSRVSLWRHTLWHGLVCCLLPRS